MRRVFKGAVALAIGLCISAVPSVDVYAGQDLNVTYRNEHYASNLRLGNSIDEIHKGGTYLDLGKKAYIQARDGKLIDHYREKTWLFGSEDREIVLDDNVNARNINILDVDGDSLDDTVFYTVDGKVRSVNVKTSKKEEIEQLKDLNIEMMFLTNNHDLYMLGEEVAYKYDVYSKVLSKVDECTNSNAFIPTEYGIIFMTGNGNDKDIIVNGNSVRDMVKTFSNVRPDMHYFQYNGIGKTNVYVRADLPETDLELYRIYNWKISIEDLFNNFKAQSFSLTYDSHYDGIYAYNRTITFKPEYNRASGYNLGTSLYDALKGGIDLNLKNGMRIYAEGNEIVCSYKNGKGKTDVVLAKEKNVSNLNFYENGNDQRLYYTVNNTLKVLYLGNGFKDYVGCTKEDLVDNVYVINDAYLYYVCEGKLMIYNINNDTKGYLEEMDCDYLPTEKGQVLFKGEGDNRTIYANGANVSDAIRRIEGNVGNNIIDYYTDDTYFYVTLYNRGESETYRITFKALFNNPRSRDFTLVIDDDRYNFTKVYGRLSLHPTNFYYSGSALIGNDMNEFTRGGRYLSIGMNEYFSADEKSITYVNNGRNIVVAKVKNAGNLNLLSTDKEDILYYTVKNKVKYVDLNTGENGVLCTFSNENIDVVKMVLINNKYIGITWNGNLYRYYLNNNKLETEVSHKNVVDFIPTDYDSSFDEDRIIAITSTSIIAETDLELPISQLFPFGRKYRINKVYIDGEYVYMDTYLEGDSFNSGESRRYRITLDTLFSIKVASVSHSSSFEQI